MKHTRMRVLWSLAAAVQCSLTIVTNTASAEAPDDLPADGAAPAEAPRFVETQLRAKVPGPTYSKDAALLDVVCNLRLDWPHKSGHVAGTVNVESQLTCNAPVSGLTLLVQLYYEGSVANSYINENAGESSLYSQVAAPCINGGWQAHAEALVVFPPGVTPPSIYDYQNSGPISIDCGF